MGDAIGERKLVGVPARDGWGLAVGALDPAFESAQAFEAKGATAHGEDVADAEVGEETFLDGAELFWTQPDAGDALGGDGADVLEEIAFGSAGAGLELRVIEMDATEDLLVLATEALAAAGEIIEDIVEFRLGQIAIRPGAGNELERLGSGPFLDAAHAHELLGEDIERSDGDAEGIEMTGACETGGGATFDEVMDIGGHEAAVADLVDAVTGAAGALEGAADALGGGDHDHQVDAADIDAEFEGRGTHDGAQFAAFEAILHLEADIAIERRVMTFDEGGEIGDLFAEPVRSGFGAAAGVGEDERGAVLTDEAGEFGNHAHATEAGGRVGIALQGRVDAEIDAFGGRNIDDLERSMSAAKKAAGFGDRGDGGGKADAVERGGRGVGMGGAEGFKTFEAERQMSAAFVFGEGVELVDDDPADGFEVG